MQKFFLHAKIHRATLTSKNIEYEGSIKIDSALMKEVGIEEGEMVQVVDVNNGERFETYVIVGEAGSGVVELNGAAARLGEVSDKLIIMAYGIFEKDEDHKPNVVVVDDKNKVIRKL